GGAGARRRRGRRLGVDPAGAEPTGGRAAARGGAPNAVRRGAGRAQLVMPPRLGEFELIARLAESVERARRSRPASSGAEVRVGTGDDAAITVPRGATATSVDALVEGVH